MNLQDLYEKLDREFSPLFIEKKPTSEEKPVLRESVPQQPSEMRSPYDPDPLRVTRPERQPIFPDNYGRSDLDPFAFDPLSKYNILFYNEIAAEKLKKQAEVEWFSIHLEIQTETEALYRAIFHQELYLRVFIF